MKRVFMIVVASVFLLNSGLVFADKGDNYFRASGMIVDMNQSEFKGNKLETKGKFKTDSGFGVSAAIGHRINKSFRTEVEFTYREASFDRGEVSFDDNGDRIMETSNDQEITHDLSNKTIMINGIYDLDLKSIVTPYAGFGFGLTWFEGLLPADQSEFGYQLLAGINIEATKNVDFVLGYRYHDTANWEYEERASQYGKVKGSYSSHNFEVGATLNF